MKLDELTKARPLPHYFDDPVRFRDWCMKEEKQYKTLPFSSKDLDTKGGRVHVDAGVAALPLSPSLLEAVDEMTGFAKVMAELAKRSPSRSGSSSPLPPVTELRRRFNTDRPTKLKVVVHERENQVIAITPVTKTALLPTQVAMWLSLTRHRLGLRAEVRRPSGKDERNLWGDVGVRLVPPDLVDLAPKNLADPVQFSVHVAYDPSYSPQIRLETEMFRLLCSNLSLLEETRTSATMPVTHDLGAARQRIETFVEESIDEMARFEGDVRALLDQPATAALQTVSDWLGRQGIPRALRKAIEYEIAVGSRIPTHYDVFNAITAARNRVPDCPDDDVLLLGRVAGDYLSLHTRPEKLSWSPFGEDRREGAIP